MERQSFEIKGKIRNKILGQLEYVNEFGGSQSEGAHEVRKELHYMILQTLVDLDYDVPDTIAEGLNGYEIIVLRDRIIIQEKICQTNMIAVGAAVLVALVSVCTTLGCMISHVK